MNKEKKLQGTVGLQVKYYKACRIYVKILHLFQLLPIDNRLKTWAPVIPPCSILLFCNRKDMVSPYFSHFAGKQHNCALLQLPIDGHFYLGCLQVHPWLRKSLYQQIASSYIEMMTRGCLPIFQQTLQVSQIPGIKLKSIR